MAAKRLLEQPAPYDSSSDDDLSESDAVVNEEEEEEEEQVEEKNGSENGVEKSGDDIDEEEEEEEEEEEAEEVEEEEEDMEEDEKVKSPVKKKKPTVSRPNDSDNSPPRSPSLASFTVEPKKKAPAEPDNKREREPDEKDSSKKKKRKVAVAEDPKKASGVAVVMWSEEDEIALLKGMSHYKAKKGNDPNADMGAFHDFIKEKLNPDITKYKLSEKIRRLKKKYLNNASKIEEDDEDPIFPKPHELRSFQLSKKIWGTDKKDEWMSNKKKKESIPTPIPSTPKTLTKTTATGKLSEKYPYLYKSLGFCSRDESIQGISKMMPLIESSELEGLDRKRKKLQIVEVECFLRKTELINEQGKLLLDILKNM
ncbi:hypothetical protein TIFTF001_055137 [Ficus carica]|uniref:Glabrous enhancer-binding protein-like DBD domain-containing protein n=1 Tax=Ficus carica TaxID=3494 RepID=A0AA88JGH2_FICCA|nr:hypothetical protein TIFTF001_055134 [Ficus carica]GMN71262.1 hypothetical protein TIFTF001_055135 [Ficus carica]GMN71266.1 hypothetical protein TIFTF001_055136 [Ficus carica]GMN71270.1 hypothetical protein TIFTF001_055137 [Ficus carica]